jgi:hypothetical protein
MRTIPVIILLFTAASLPARAQAPKDGRSIVGVWVLKSATVNGKTATDKELAGLLKDFGGCELGMAYKFRKAGGDGLLCSLNDREGGYGLIPETKELSVLMVGPGNVEHNQTFGMKFIEKNLQLRFREKDKVVLMLFTSDD